MPSTMVLVVILENIYIHTHLDDHLNNLVLCYLSTYCLLHLLRHHDLLFPIYLLD